MSETREDASNAGELPIADLWNWPFGMWRTATEAWLNASAQFLGGAAPSSPLSPVTVDPWAALRAWMPQVDAVVEPLPVDADKPGEEATRVRMRLQLPGWGGVVAGEMLSIDAVVRRQANAVAGLLAAPAEMPALPAQVIRSEEPAPTVEAAKPRRRAPRKPSAE